MNTIRTAATIAFCMLALSVAPGYCKVVQVGENDNGKSVTLSNGDTLEIALPGNITTGFSWAVTSVAGKALQPTGKVDYSVKPTALVGAPGLFTAKFNAVSTGKSVVGMAYRRPWEEKKKKAARTFVVTVSIKK